MTKEPQENQTIEQKLIVGIRCKYCNKGIYIPSIGNLRDVVKRHEDKCPDNPNKKV